MVAYMRDVQRFVGKLNVHATDQDEYTCTAFLNGLPSKMLMTMRSMQGNGKRIARMKCTLENHNSVPPRKVFDIAAEPSHLGNQLRNDKTVINANGSTNGAFRGACFCCGEISHTKRFCRVCVNAFCTKCNQNGHFFKASGLGRRALNLFLKCLNFLEFKGIRLQ